MTIALVALFTWIVLGMVSWHLVMTPANFGDGCGAIVLAIIVVGIVVVAGDLAMLAALFVPAIRAHMTWYACVIWLAPQAVIVYLASWVILPDKKRNSS